MAFGFPVSTKRRRAFIALRRASRRVIAPVLVTCAGTSVAVAGAVDARPSRSIAFERNVWQPPTYWLADPPAPPIRFGAACATIAQFPDLPAALAGPVAVPAPVVIDTCNLLDEMRSDATDTAAAMTNSGWHVVALFREPRWQIGDHVAAEPNGLLASDAVASTMSRRDSAEQPPELPTMSTPDCALGGDCETPTVAPSIDTATRASVQLSASAATQSISVWTKLGLILWAILVVVLVVGAAVFS